MTRVVAVHGIAQQYSGPASMHAAWFPALHDGLAGIGLPIGPEDVTCAFYGDVFRGPARVLGGAGPTPAAGHVAEGLEQELLFAWWAEAARVDRAVVPPDARTLGIGGRQVQAALRALSSSRFFAGLAEHLLIFALKQVRSYLTDPGVRSAVQARVVARVGPETRVLVAHSLGSVVAYEALCAHSEWSVHALVTLGSPLGIRNLIFDRLVPAPDPGCADSGRRGRWPGATVHWTNIADESDVVALVKDLRPLFGDRVRCILVDCGARAHEAVRYLTAPSTGRAIAAGLHDG